MTNNPKTWWGEFSVPLGHTAYWRLGPMRLYASCGDSEWRIAFCSGESSTDPAFEMGIGEDPPPKDDELTVNRYAFASAHDRLQLAPRLADRPIVVQPATPLFLPAGQTSTLYVSTVAWLALSAVADEPVPLLETTIYRPSDTWFGSSTRYGELCYASRTLARTASELLDQLVHRVITPVVIENNGTDLLPIEQLKVPAPNLSVYEGPDGRLWTETVVFDRKDDHDQATLRIADKPSQEGRFDRLSPPREALLPNVVVRAFSRLFR